MYISVPLYFMVYENKDYHYYKGKFIMCLQQKGLECCK